MYKEVFKNLYLINDRGANYYLLVGKELVLVDTGYRSSFKVLKRVLCRLGRSVRDIGLIIITHNHLDHCGDYDRIKEVSDARLAIHRADIMEESGNALYHGAIGKVLGIPPLKSLSRRVHVRALDVDIKLEGGEVFDLLGGLKIIHTPGHTAGSISVYAPEMGWLFVGDTINHRFKKMRLPPKGVSLNIGQVLDSIKKLTAFNVKSIFFGHGSPVLRDASRKLIDEIGL